MLLSLLAATLLPLTRLLLIRVRVFGTIRVVIFEESRHELPHVIAVVLKPPRFLRKGRKRQFFSNIRTAEPALILSDECIIAEIQHTQLVVDSLSLWTQE